MKYALTKRAHAQQTMAVGFTRECTGYTPSVAILSLVAGALPDII